MKIKVKTTSERFWWGIHGLVKKNGWEDLDIYDEQGKLIDRIHLYAKDYLRAGLRFLKDDAFQLDYSESVNKYLNDKQYYFWYYYDEKDDPDKFEVDYEAPKNKEGIKPKAIEIWSPEETIDLTTIVACVKEFASRFLKAKACTIEINPMKSFEASVESFKSNEEEFGDERVKLNSKQMRELSRFWKQSK